MDNYLIIWGVLANSDAAGGDKYQGEITPSPPTDVPGGGLFYILRKNLAMCTMWNLIVVDVSRIGKGLRQHMGTDKMLKSKTCKGAAVGGK